MSHFGEQITSIALAIVGVAIIAVIVSNRSQTANVISAAGDAFSLALRTAVSPISGFTAGAGTGFNGFQNTLPSNNFYH